MTQQHFVIVGKFYTYTGFGETQDDWYVEEKVAAVFSDEKAAKEFCFSFAGQEAAIIRKDAEFLGAEIQAWDGKEKKVVFAVDCGWESIQFKEIEDWEDWKECFMHYPVLTVK